MASEAGEILAIDTKEDIEDGENIIEIPIDEPPDVPKPIKTQEFQCERSIAGDFFYTAGYPLDVFTGVFGCEESRAHDEKF